MIEDSFLSQCELYIKNGGIVSGTSFSRISIPFCKMMEVDTKAADEYLKSNRDLPFNELLFLMIDRSGQKDSDIYKRARIDRRLFSKIRSNKKYIPSKKTVVALCLALRLSRSDADLLLSSAGYSLSKADDYDLAISFCIDKKVYDFYDINEVLDHFGFDLF